MINDLRITVLVDNTVTRSGLLAEHGLSFWIQADRQHMLFDVGQGGVLSHNLEALGIDLAIAEAIVISHGHYDHTGCLDTVLEKMPTPKLYLHPDAVKKKYARCSAPPHREIGMPEPARKAVLALGQNVIWTRHVTEIFPSMHVTGQIPRRSDNSDTGGPFFLDSKCSEPDPLFDDQAIFFETAEGVVVVLGCAHAGVASTLDYIFEITNRRQIIAVIGGTHLSGAGKFRLQETIDAFERYQVPKIAPAHCTGIDGTATLWNRLPGRCLPCSAGTTFHFGGD
jgi:7,8-dihydropterin-6-yl-methyl-4-(beta-D-ribofuranosyl)aminobenzene 5'-phosphate synthase